MEQTTTQEAVPACCGESDPASAQKCVLCLAAVCGKCLNIVNEKTTCKSCLAKIMAELEAEGKDVSLKKAAGAGIAAAAAAGLAWGLIVKLTEAEIGYAAVGVGWLAGKAVHWASGSKRSKALQKVALGCAVLGLIMGKYFTVAFLVQANVPEAAELGLLSPRMMTIFAVLAPKIIGMFDLLWLALAMSAAWRVPAPMEVQVAGGVAPPASSQA